MNLPVEQPEAASSPRLNAHRSSSSPSLPSSPPPLPPPVRPRPTTPAVVRGPEKITRDLPPLLARPLRGPRRSDWVPPGPGLRLLLGVGVLIAAVILARRWPIGADGSSREIAGAREVVGYELGSQPITLALPPGTTVYKVATNLDLPAGGAPSSASLPASDPGVPYVVRVRVPEDGRDEAFALLARPALDPAGKSTAFFRDRAGAPARTAVLTLRRTSTRPATLQVSLETPGDARAVRASLRVFVAHERIGAGPGPQRAPTVGGLALEDLDPEVRAAFLSQSWGRLPARSLTPTRTFFLPAAPAVSTPSFDRGHVVGAGHVLVVTVKGPGTVDVLAPPAWQGEVSLLYPGGQGRSWPLQSSQADANPDPVSVAIGKGLCTLRISARDAAAPPVRVRLSVADPNMIVDDHAADHSAERGDGRNDVGPAWSWQVVARAQAAGPPVIFAAAGRRQAAFRITGWVPFANRSAAAAPLVRWRFVDARGAMLLQGKTALDATPAPEDHLEGGVDAPEGGGLVSQPTTFHLWPPRAAHRLLIDADGAADVAVASPGFDAQPFAPDASATLGPLADSIQLRHARQDRQAFYPVHPFNATDLQRAGRIERLAGALRLERLPPRPPPKGVAVSLGPQRDGGRFVILLPKTQGGPEAGPARRQGHLWALRSQSDETVIVPRPRGTAGTARVPATVLYELARPSGRQPLVVRLDGQVIRRASLLGARGQIVLPPIAVGKHRLRIDLATPARLFFDQPVAGAAVFRRSQVYLLPAGAAGVAVDKGRAPRALGLVMYIDGPPPRGRAPTLDVVVDGGKRRRVATGASTAFTRLRRIEELTFERAPGAVYLNRRAGAIWSSRPIFVPLGDDLTAGTHRVSLHARGLGGRGRALAARFFSYGGRQVNRINQHVEMSVDVAPDRGSEALP